MRTNKQLLTDERCKQLGCAVSSANARLTRMVLFNFLVCYRLNICLRCNKTIDVLEDFSLDHEIPWLHGSPSLFWDVDNVKFSHRRCNSGAHRSKVHRKDGRRNDAKDVRLENFNRWINKPGNRELRNKRERARVAKKKAYSSSG